MARLLASSLHPFLVRFRLRNPCVLARLSRLVRAVVGRGPHLIWEATPPSAGCDVMAVLGTRSRTEVAACDDCSVANGNGECDERKSGLARGQVVGLREGSDEKCLCEPPSLCTITPGILCTGATAIRRRGARMAIDAMVSDRLGKKERLAARNVVEPERLPSS